MDLTWHSWPYEEIKWLLRNFLNSIDRLFRFMCCQQRNVRTCFTTTNTIFPGSKNTFPLSKRYSMVNLPFFSAGKKRRASVNWCSCPHDSARNDYSLNSLLSSPPQPDRWLKHCSTNVNFLGVFITKHLSWIFTWRKEERQYLVSIYHSAEAILRKMYLNERQKFHSSLARVMI